MRKWEKNHAAVNIRRPCPGGPGRTIYRRFPGSATTSRADRHGESADVVDGAIALLTVTIAKTAATAATSAQWVR